VEEKKMKIDGHNPGLTCFLDGVRMVPIESIPGVLDAGWTPSTRATRNSPATEETTDIDALTKQLKKVLQFVSILIGCQRNTCFISDSCSISTKLVHIKLFFYSC